MEKKLLESRACKRFLESAEYRRCGQLFCFVSLPQEPDTLPILQQALKDGKTVAAMDCLVPGIGEIIGGSQREDDYDKLKSRMDELGLKEEDYKFYMDLRKYGSTRHAGFGLGFERCVMYLTGMGNIRDVIPFPRTPKNAEF